MRVNSVTKYQIEQTGEGVIVQYGRQHKKVAVLLPYSPQYEQQSPRQFGILQGGMATSYKVSSCKNGDKDDQPIATNE